LKQDNENKKEMKRRRVKNEEEGGKKPDGYTPTTLCW